MQEHIDRDGLLEVEGSNSLTDLELPTPVVSVDRALGHLVDNIDVDLDTARAFYNDLPHEDKPDFGNLRIHMSAAMPLHQKKDQSITYGTFYPYGVSGQSELKHKAPEVEATDQPTIVLYLGSALILKNNEEEHGFAFVDRIIGSDSVNDLINNTLTHELTHLAQATDDNIEKGIVDKDLLTKRFANSAGSVAISAALGVMRNGRELLTGAAAGVMAELTTEVSAGGSVTMGVGTTTVALVLNSGRRRRETTERNDRKFNRYIDDENEVDARSHEDHTQAIMSVGIVDTTRLPNGYGAASLIKPQNSRLRRFIANKQHEDLSGTPRGLDPIQVRKEALKSRINGRKVRREIEANKHKEEAQLLKSELKNLFSKS